jgi:hypothetical protein
MDRSTTVTNQTGHIRLLIIDDSYIAAMSKNAQVKTLLPFIDGVAKPTGQRSCGTCGAGRSQAITRFNDIKRQIGELPETTARQLLELLNAEQYRVTYLNAAGQVVKKTVTRAS